MKVLNPRRLKQYQAAHPDAGASLRTWWKTAQTAEWKSFSDVSRTFRNADQVGDRIIFNIEPRPIRSEQEADAVTGVIDALTDLPELTEGQRDFVGLLGQLLHDWEAEHDEPIEVSPVEAVRSLLEDNGLRQVDLVGPVFPSASAVSDFLGGRRPLSYERVRKLAQFFHVSPALFFRASFSARPGSRPHVPPGACP